MTQYKVGDKVNRLTIIGQVRRGKRNELNWECRCECGNEKQIFAPSAWLRNGVIRSCGCYAKDMASARATKMRERRPTETACAVCGTVFISVSDKSNVCSSECRFTLYEGKTPEGCWEWEGPVNNQGYGVLFLNTNKSNGRRMVASAHRHAYEKYKGAIQDGLCVMHTCDNRKCTNPEHLLVGTWADNNGDRSKKGRSGKRVYSDAERLKYSVMLRGEGGNNTKLTEAQAIEIKYDNSLSSRVTALKYGVTASAVKAIRANRTWKHI